MRTAERAEKFISFLSLRLLGSPWNSERSRQPGEERRRRGEPLTRAAEPESARPGSERRLCLRPRRRRALPSAGPSPGARRAPGRPDSGGARLRPGCSLAPARVLAAPRSAAAPPRAGPAPTRRAPTCCDCGRGGRPALGGRGRPPPPRARLLLPQPPGPLRRAVPGRSARSVDRPSDPAPSEATSPEGRGPAFSESNPAPRGSFSAFPAWEHAPVNPPSPLSVLTPPRGGTPLSSAREGWGGGSGVLLRPAGNPGLLYRVRPCSDAAAGGGGAWRRRGQPGLGGGEGTPPKVEGHRIARAPVQSLAPGL